MKSQRLLLTAALGLGLTLALLAWLRTVRASSTAHSLFVTPTGGDTACTQAAPCILATALNLAVDGDTIYAASGVYTGTGTEVIHVTKSITLYGGWDGAPSGPVVRDPQAYLTILDGENARRMVLISLPVSPILEGLTLQRGNAAGLDGDPAIPGADAGGGVYAKNASPTISNCRILSSTAGFGAGLALYGGTPAVINSVIADNVAIQSMSGITRGVGGGMFLYQSAGVVAGNLIVNNVASGTQTYDGGGGLYLDDSTTLVRNNTIQGNRGPHNGGGMMVYGSAITVRGNVILSNTGGIGGGVILMSSPAYFEANTILGNEATAGGGGLVIFDSVSFTLTNNVVAQNHGTYPAALLATGLYAGSYSQGVLIHNTFADNYSSYNPWVIDLGSSSVGYATLVFTNNIIGPLGGVYVAAGSTAVLDTTLWDRIPIGTETAGPGTIISSTNLYGNANFVGQYRISPGSSAIDQGANTGIATDIDGEARPNGARPDIGADEFYCYALSGVTIAGPTSGISGTAIALTAVVSPPTGTLPVTYTWQATSQAPLSRTVYALSDTATFTWTVTGVQAITVTAANCGGSVTDTRTITIYHSRVYLPLVLRQSM